jgi:sigma-B regulation protein RsbQ
VTIPRDPIHRHHVTVEGDPRAARTLVFAHGFGSDQTAWDRVASSLRSQFRVVRYDHAGSGRSDPAAFVQYRYLKLGAYAQDLLDIVDALELENAVFVGHSMGAMVGLLAAVERPELFERLVLIGASPRFLDDDGYRGGFSVQDLEGVYRAMHENFARWANGFAPAMIGPDQPRAQIDHFAESMKSIPPERALTIAYAVFQSDHRAELARLARPTLLIQTRSDRAVPMEVAQFMQARIRDSRLVVIDADGHLPHVTAPDAVVAAIRDFIVQPAHRGGFTGWTPPPP